MKSSMLLHRFILLCATIALFLTALSGSKCLAAAGGTPAPAAAGKNDFTNHLKLSRGTIISIPIYRGIDTRWKHIGDYEFLINVDSTDSGGFSFDWTMGPPANAAGHRAVDAEDVRSSHKVSLFYPDGQNCTMAGWTNAIRVSDSLYAKLKSGYKTSITLDGPEIPYKRHEHLVPQTIQPVGTEMVNIVVDGKRKQVRTIKAQTDNGWTYWILDNPEFPMIVQGNAPFAWAEPRFSHGLAGAESEANRVISDLNKTGEATSRKILFAFDSDQLTPQSKLILRELSAYLQKKPDLRLTVEGHTDSIGSMNYNMDLSERRANSVIVFLSEECRIDRSRLKAAGFGYTKPVASNDTDAGRAQNRRVVFKKL